MNRIIILLLVGMFASCGESETLKHKKSGDPVSDENSGSNINEPSTANEVSDEEEAGNSPGTNDHTPNEDPVYFRVEPYDPCDEGPCKPPIDPYDAPPDLNGPVTGSYGDANAP